MLYTKPSVFVKEVFSGKLNLNSQAKNLAVEISDKIQELGNFFNLGIIEGRNPKTIAACSIYISLKLLNITQITLKEISRVSEIADNTIKNAYRDIYQYRFKIIPEEYKNQANLNLVSN